MCVSVCKCDECSFFNYCINMDFESVNKDLFSGSMTFMDLQNCINTVYLYFVETLQLTEAGIGC